MISEAKIGTHGYVQLLKVFGTEATICDAARVSYGEGTKSVSDDTTLIRYLMRHRHTTPLEQVEFRFRIQMPMDTHRQMIRHRMASVNEYSTRYSEAIDLAAETKADEWRLQSQSNKQGSADMLVDWPPGTEDLNQQVNTVFGPAAVTPGEYLSARENALHDLSRAIYKERLLFGVAREQARKDLVLSTYTRYYWKMDLHNLLHFLGLRMDAHAQLEIREYANAIGDMVRAWGPNIWQAFIDYRLEARTLTRLDRIVLQAWIRSPGSDLALTAAAHISNKREQQECITKLSGLV